MPLQVITIVVRNQLACLAKCKDFAWKIQNTTYKFDMWVIPTGSCDVVLVIQWLERLGVVKWDFRIKS